MARKKTEERKVGETSKEQMRRGIDLIREGNSIHKAAQAFGIHNQHFEDIGKSQMRLLI